MVRRFCLWRAGVSPKCFHGFCPSEGGSGGFCFYTKMRWDGAVYASHRERKRLPHLLFETTCPMYNRETGFDMVYQENKVFNLKLAAATLDRLLIRPGETFSFWRLVRYADRKTPYRDGLAEVNGKLTVQPGGGLCQLSNLLFWMFLHTPSPS